MSGGHDHHAPPTPDPTSGHYGILVEYALPDESWIDRWVRIVVPDELKQRMVNFGAFALMQRSERSQVALPIHGLLLLQGPPGTGKTTLARGLADQVARMIRDRDGRTTIFAEVDAHSIGSGVLGESQRQVDRVFQRSIRLLARQGRPVIVLIDEVENLAVARDRASLQANPTDVHRSTNAVLTGLDSIWNQFTNVLFIATSNFPDSIDAAFLSRVDLVVDVPVPPRELARRILVDTMREVAGDATAAAVGAEEAAALDAVLDATEGIDARRLRKVILEAIVERRETAIDPQLLRWADVISALSATGRAG
jgi:SpoVK/Ycf46/Vps4 family AAA+-type ATPase